MQTYIEYVALFNAFSAILAFAMKQVKIYGLKPDGKKKEVKGETFSKGSLASIIPNYPEPILNPKDYSMLYFIFSPIFNREQFKNFLTVACCVFGIYETTYSAPVIMLYMTLTEIDVMKKITYVIMGRFKQIMATFTLVGMLGFYVSYITFL